jgi:hypothetical protein
MQSVNNEGNVLQKIGTVEWRAKMSAKNYLGFGRLQSPIKTYTDSDYKYYGEVNANGKLHGRGTRIYRYGTILIGYFENGEWRGTGNYIIIHSDGKFDVGELYRNNGRISSRGTEY